jgi:hypothetical protein
VVVYRAWLAAGGACILAALAVAGCGKRDLVEAPSPEVVDDDGGALGAEDDASAALDSSVIVSVSIAEDERCLISEAYAGALRWPCPDVSMDATPCQGGDATCVYYLEQAATAPMVVCRAFCDFEGSEPHWSLQCHTACNRECPEPAPDTLVMELDTSDCEMRPLMPCPDGALTLQGELDQMLLNAIGGPSAPLGEINESRVFVEFENGCPSRFYSGNRPLTLLGPHIVEHLARARWACAVRLSCSAVEGPSTLVTQ